MIWTIVGVILLFWLLGFALHVGEGFIHLLLVLVVIGVIYQLMAGRRV